jgi:hypothetical protein
MLPKDQLYEINWKINPKASLTQNALLQIKSRRISASFATRTADALRLRSRRALSSRLYKDY